MYRRRFWLVTAAVAVAVAGCHHTCCKKRRRRATVARRRPAPRSFSRNRPSGAGADRAGSPPRSLDAGARRSAASCATQPGAVEAIRRSRRARAPAVHLLQPELSESVQQAAASEPVVAENKSAAQPMPSAPLPVGIPGFAPAISDRVANGRKPALEGLDWLKTNNYRGALVFAPPARATPPIAGNSRRATWPSSASKWRW